MTSLRFVERHVRGLHDIRAIMNSMKTLAYIETQKLERLVPAQRAVSQQLGVASADLLAHYPDILPTAIPLQHVRIVLGTERGFCGDFNQRLLDRLATEFDGSTSNDGPILAVGRKLQSALEGDWREQVVLIDGAGVAEEVPTVLNRIVDELETLRSEHGPATVSAICYLADGELDVRTLLPPFQEIPVNDAKRAHPPMLNIPPERLLLDLTDQYFFSSLFETLYESLLTENHRRVKHLNDAVRHLDKECVDLTHRSNALRQEQITEEIEVLLLSIGPAGMGARKESPSSRIPTESGSRLHDHPDPRRHEK